jgi:hypothetical protein
MLRKPIAAALLVAMTAWVEMALAPWFAMYIQHQHAAHEMHAHMAAHEHAMPAGHPCCLSLAKTANGVVLELAGDGLPCEDQHRCCFRQAPPSVPAPAAGRGILRELAALQIVEMDARRDARAVASEATPVALRPPPSSMSMVLRV